MKIEEQVAAVLAKANAVVAAVNKAFIKSYFDDTRQEWRVSFADGNVVNEAVVAYEEARATEEDPDAPPHFVDGTGKAATALRGEYCARCGAPALVPFDHEGPAFCESCERQRAREGATS